MLIDDFETHYAWTVTLSPLATALGMFPCWFFAKRLGPKRTILIQTPFNVLFWILAAFFTSGIQLYNVFRFFIAFFSTTYYYCGEELMIETVHRKYQKVMYACCRTSVFLGILIMNSVGALIKKMDLFLYLASAVVVIFIVLLPLPESPVFLMRLNPEKAKKSLRWYRGNRETGELEIMANYVSFQKYETSGFVPMLKTKVVMKALKICSILFMLKGLSGYYAFTLYSPRWFIAKYSCVTPAVDSVIFSSIVCVVRFISVLLHLYGAFGIKKPLIVSTFTTSVLLIIFGYYKFILERVAENTGTCVTLPSMCMYACAYECGLSICPEITLYNYLPFQIYSLVNKIMQMMLWIVVFIVTRVYILTITKFHSHVTLWVLATNMFIGYILVMIFVVETKGKSLMKIQIELEGNPVGTRGSRRQRIANPMDQVNTDSEIRDLIKKFGNPDQPPEQAGNSNA